MLKEEIHASMNKIPDLILRKIIWQRFYYDYSWEEIGNTLGITAAAAKMRWIRFQKKGVKRENHNDRQDVA